MPPRRAASRSGARWPARPLCPRCSSSSGASRGGRRSRCGARSSSRCPPLFWFSALRPLTDMLGFAAVDVGLALMADATARRGLLAGALLAGFADRHPLADRGAHAADAADGDVLAAQRGSAIGAIGAFAAGVLLWGVPLIAASGGVSSYLEALGPRPVRISRAFSCCGRIACPPRHRLRAGQHVRLAVGLVAGACRVRRLQRPARARLAWRAPRALLTLLALFAPYAVFHLLFQETATTRYALPLLPVVAYPRDGRGRRPAGTRIAGDGARHLRDLAGRDGSGVDQLRARGRAGVSRVRRHGGDRARRRSASTRIALHAATRRAAEWAAPILPARVARRRTAASGWRWWRCGRRSRRRASGSSADPERTDLALFDSRARDLARAYRWGFVEPPVRRRRASRQRRLVPHAAARLDARSRLGASRPEVGGVTARDRLGPHVAPAIAWLRHASRMEHDGGPRRAAISARP